MSSIAFRRFLRPVLGAFSRPRPSQKAPLAQRDMYTRVTSQPSEGLSGLKTPIVGRNFCAQTSQTLDNVPTLILSSNSIPRQSFSPDLRSLRIALTDSDAQTIFALAALMKQLPADCKIYCTSGHLPQYRTDSLKTPHISAKHASDWLDIILPFTYVQNSKSDSDRERVLAGFAQSVRLTASDFAHQHLIEALAYIALFTCDTKTKTTLWWLFKSLVHHKSWTAEAQIILVRVIRSPNGEKVADLLVQDLLWLTHASEKDDGHAFIIHALVGRNSCIMRSSYGILKPQEGQVYRRATIAEILAECDLANELSNERKLALAVFCLDFSARFSNWPVSVAWYCAREIERMIGADKLALFTDASRLLIQDSDAPIISHIMWAAASTRYFNGASPHSAVEHYNTRLHCISAIQHSPFFMGTMRQYGLSRLREFFSASRDAKLLATAGLFDDLGKLTPYAECNRQEIVRLIFECDAKSMLRAMKVVRLICANIEFRLKPPVEDHFSPVHSTEMITISLQILGSLVGTLRSASLSEAQAADYCELLNGLLLTNILKQIQKLHSVSPSLLPRSEMSTVSELRETTTALLLTNILKQLQKLHRVSPSLLPRSEMSTVSELRETINRLFAQSDSATRAIVLELAQRLGLENGHLVLMERQWSSARALLALVQAPIQNIQSLQNEIDASEDNVSIRKLLRSQGYTNWGESLQLSYQLTSVSDPVTIFIAHSLADNLRACAMDYVGCYSADSRWGHPEKPVYNGLSVNSKLLVLRHGTKDAENIEVECTEHGLFVHKIYKADSSSDSNHAWIDFLCQLIERQQAPRLLIPANFPNAAIYQMLQKDIGQEQRIKTDGFRPFGMVLSSHFDNAWYRDFYPALEKGEEKLGLVIDPSNVAKIRNRLLPLSDAIQKKVVKDPAKLWLSEVVQNLRTNADLRSRALALGFKHPESFAFAARASIYDGKSIAASLAAVRWDKFKETVAPDDIARMQRNLANFGQLLTEVIDAARRNTNS